MKSSKATGNGISTARSSARTTFEPVSAYVLVRAAVSREAIYAAAAGEGWRTQYVENCLFMVVKLWIEDVVLVEFLAKGEAARYVDAFGSAWMAGLDGKLRDLETPLSGALAQKLSVAALTEALGRSPSL